MRKGLIRCTILFLFLIGFSLLCQPGNSLAAADSQAAPATKEEKLIRAKVTGLNLEQRQDKGNAVQSVELTILEGNYKQQKFAADFQAAGIFYGITLRENDEVFVTLTLDSAGNVQEVNITEIARDKYMTYLLLGFIGLLILIGGSKGVRAVLALLATYFVIIKVLLPLILQGYNPVYITVGLCSIITLITLLLVGGYNKKTFAAVVGTLCGLGAAAYLAVLVGSLSHLTGAVDEDFYLLEYLPPGTLFSYQGLLFAGIIIGSLGAVMDVSMSIASAVNELSEKSYRISSLQLIKAGLNVGRDTIGTMANTLILAYAGGSIYLLLLLAAENVSLYQLINRESIASEILRSMAGSIGLVLTVPVTALVAGLLSREGRT